MEHSYHSIEVHEEGLKSSLEMIYKESFFLKSEKPYLKNKVGANGNTTPSPWALDTRVAFSRGRLLRLITPSMAKILERHHVSQIVGRGYGSFLLIGGILSVDDQLTGGLLRHSRKTYGFQHLVEGGLDRNLPLFIVDDILASGNSSLQAINLLRQEEYHPIGVLVVFHFGWKAGAEILQSLGIIQESLATLYRIKK